MNTIKRPFITGAAALTMFGSLAVPEFADSTGSNASPQGNALDSKHQISQAPKNNTTGELVSAQAQAGEWDWVFSLSSWNN